MNVSVPLSLGPFVVTYVTGTPYFVSPSNSLSFLWLHRPRFTHYFSHHILLRSLSPFQSSNDLD